MNFKKYHVSRNLFDLSSVEKGRIDNGDVGYTSQTTSLSIVGGTVYFTTNAAYRGVCSGFFEIPETGNITFNFTRNLPLGVKFVFYDSNKTWLNADVAPQLIDIPPATASIPTGAKYVRLSFTGQLTGGSDYVMSDIMLNVGSSPLPYEPYSSEVWHDTPHYIHNTATDTFTTLPVVLYPNDTTATVGVKGNTVQTGTPTPDNPIMPQGTGEMTENLCDESTLQNGYFDTTTYRYYPSNNYRCFSMSLSAGTYTIFAKSDSLTIRLLRVSSASLGANAVNLDNRAYTFTLSATETIYVSMRNSTTTNDFTGLTIMLNTGDRALPYEPYGQYKIPISSADTTTPVYLGEVETTRRIRKLVLTGQETWTYESNRTRFYMSISDVLVGAARSIPIMSTHFVGVYDGRTEAQVGNNSIYVALNTNLYIKTTEYNSETAFTEYLQQQYANGTPVTVWYVLASETTGIVNEPLMKIGDYADTVSGITVPTITGKDTFDVDTTLKPSEVELTYTGWHDATVEEWDGSQWNE